MWIYPKESWDPQQPGYLEKETQWKKGPSWFLMIGIVGCVCLGKEQNNLKPDSTRWALDPVPSGVMTPIDGLFF